MKIDPPPPASRREQGSPRGFRGRAASSAAESGDVAASGGAAASRARGASRAGPVLLVLALGCGGSSQEPVEASGCASNDDCAEGQLCRETACIAQIQPRPDDVGVFACSVVNCPSSERGCCSTAVASATGNERQGYATRNQMVDRAYSVRGEVRADFSFDAADQQGWVTFRLGAELDLVRLEFTGRHLGVADRFLSVNTNQSEDAGCAYAFQLQPRPPPAGAGPFVLGNAVAFNDDDFCYGDARPGRANELAFAIFSLGPGEASLIISNINLTAD